MSGFSGGGGGVSDHTLLTNIGTNTHAQLDAKFPVATADIAANAVTQVGSDSSSASQTTTSTAYTATTEAITLTTTGSDVLLCWSACLVDGGSCGLIDIAVSVDGGADQGLVRNATAGVASGANVTAAFIHLITGLSAASHTFAVRWKVSAGTGELRGDLAKTQFVAMELKR